VGCWVDLEMTKTELKGEIKWQMYYYQAIGIKDGVYGMNLMMKTSKKTRTIHVIPF